MKKLLFTLALLPLIAAADPTSEPQGGDGMFREKFRQRWMEKLPPEIQKRLEAAREKVMAEPQIAALREKAEASNREFRRAVREAMIKADPELAEWMKKNLGRGKDGFPRDGKGLGSLTEEERQKLLAARAKAQSDPAVQAAEQKKKDATTPEARRAAAEEFHQTMQSTLLRIDPSLAPILEKMKAPRGPGGKPQPAA